VVGRPNSTINHNKSQRSPQNEKNNRDPLYVYSSNGINIFHRVTPYRKI